jgi:hypothetical protein
MKAGMPSLFWGILWEEIQVVKNLTFSYPTTTEYLNLTSANLSQMKETSVLP